MKKVKGLKPFGKFIMTIGQLPASYLVSMTYEEQLIWLCNYLQNVVIPTVNNNGEAVEELQNLFIELKDYVDNYFDNLDVQEEINNKLDDMAESGELADIIAEFLTIGVLFTYDTALDLGNAQNLDDGTNAYILGKETYNDGKGAFYKIREIRITDVIDGDNIIAITNSEDLVAEKLPNYYINEINSHLDTLDNEVDIIYDTLSDLLADTNLYDDKNVRTLGYYSLNDGGGAFFKIREALESEEANNITTYETTNGLIAEIIDNSKELYAKKYGVKCDKVSDDITKLQALVNYCKTNGKTLVLDGYTYISSTLDTKGINIKGIGRTLHPVYTYTSKTYGNIGWTYLKNTGEGALITFADYVNDNLDQGSGIISDTANPIVSVNNADGRFHLEDLSIVGWLRNNGQVGIKNTFDISNPPLYMYGAHRLNNVSVVNCGGNGIQLTNLEMTTLRNVIVMLNFGYGIYIDGQDDIDTPTEYSKLDYCRINGNRLGGIYINKGFNKNLTFENCEFSANGLYEELALTIPDNLEDVVAGITINSYKKAQDNLTIDNCYGERLELFAKILTYSSSPVHTFNNIRVINNTMYPLDSNGGLLYYDNYYTSGFEFHDNNMNQGTKFAPTDRSKTQFIPFSCDQNVLNNIQMFPELTFHQSLNVTTNNCKRYGNLIYIRITASVTANIAAWQTLISNFPKPMENVLMPMIHNGTFKANTWYTNRTSTSGTAFTSGDEITWLGVYYVSPFSNKDGNY